MASRYVREGKRISTFAEREGPSAQVGNNTKPGRHSSGGVTANKNHNVMTRVAMERNPREARAEQLLFEHAKKAEHSTRSTREGPETSTGNGRSLLSRLKCKSTSNERCDNIGHPSKSNNHSKSVHKIRTPWLVVGSEDDSNHRSKIGRENDLNAHLHQQTHFLSSLPDHPFVAKPNPGIDPSESMPSAANVEVAVVGNSKGSDRVVAHTLPSSESKKQNKNCLGSALFGRRRRKSTKSGSEVDEQNVHNVYQAREVSNAQAVSIDVQRGTPDSKLTHNHEIDERHRPKTYQIQRGELLRDTCYDNQFSFSNGSNSILEHRQDDRGFGSSSIGTNNSAMNTENIWNSEKERQRYNISEHQQNSPHELKTEGNNFRGMEIEKERAGRLSEQDITTPRRRNSRSPSPSRFRQQTNSTDCPVREELNQTQYPQTNLTTKVNLDHSMLMGLEMYRQLDQISRSFDCGAVGGKTPRSMPPQSENEIPKEENKSFSIFSPSSISCLNPSSQIDLIKSSEMMIGERGIGRENTERIVTGRLPKMETQKMTSNTFCSSASSALLLDVKDDDPLWQYLDERAVPNLKVSSNQNRLTPFDRVRGGEERDQTVERNYYSDNSNSIDPRIVQHPVDFVERKIPASEYEEERRFAHLDYIPNIPVSDVSPMEKNIEDSGYQYESLMGYPQETRHAQLNKEILLEKMKYAVDQASARLETNRKNKNLDAKFDERYHIVMTMETESTDDSGLTPDHSFSYHGHQRHNKFQNGTAVYSFKEKDRYDIH